jgi:hypothetical protein
LCHFCPFSATHVFHHTTQAVVDSWKWFCMGIMLGEQCHLYILRSTMLTDFRGKVDSFSSLFLACVCSITVAWKLLHWYFTV